MRRVSLTTLIGSMTLLATLVIGSSALAQEAEPPASTLTINGEPYQVRWSDGDSFRILDGQYEGQSVRLGGFNALESYGPVHRWGEWTAQELYEIAHLAGEFARAGVWSCSASGETDHYDRLLVTCDGLTTAIVAAGIGHLFAIGTPASPDAIAAQSAARQLRLGMWAKGVPNAIVTSLHSAGEGGDRIYNRVISTVDGGSTEVFHEETFEVCQEVCIGDACLLYIPYDQRYGDSRAACLQPASDQAE